MPMLQKGAAMVADKLPKVISPKTHAIIDFVNAGTFFVMGALFMKKRSKKAGLSAMICGGATLANVLMTDMPGGIGPNSMTTHLRIDAGLAATCAAMPSLMKFDDESAAKWFMRSEGIAITAVGGMTDAGENYSYDRERAA